MNTLRTLKKLVLGETWLLPLGIAAVVAASALLVRPLASHAWAQVGGFILLAGVLAVLLASVARAAHALMRPAIRPCQRGADDLRLGVPTRARASTAAGQATRVAPSPPRYGRDGEMADERRD